MATTVRNLDSLKADQAITANNTRRLDMMKMKLGLLFHADASACTAGALVIASDLPTTIAIANALQADYNAHAASACSARTGVGAHVAADATNVSAAAAATDQGTANTLLTDIKTQFNAHLSQAGVHCTNDGTNSVATADATTLNSSIALANALVTKLTAHFGAAMATQAVTLVSP